MTTARTLAALMTLTCVGAAPLAEAQSPAPTFEVGGHASLLRLSDFDTTNAGIGGRFLVDITDWLAADIEGAFFPNDDVATPLGASTNANLRIAHLRRRADGFFGVKTGIRRNRVGVFARMRPGFTRLFDQGVQCVGPDCARILMLLVRDEYRTEFALDLGGGVEVYPSPLTVARFEFGDTMIRHRSFAPPCPMTRCTSHNFSTRVGAGLRF